MMTATILPLLSLLLPLRLSLPPASEDNAVSQLLLTKEQALDVVFPACDEVREIRHMLTPDDRQRIERRLGRPLTERGFLVYTAWRQDRLDGMAIITAEKGKFQPITFIVGVNVDGTVRRSAVMVYRESHGGEIKARRFQHQFEGMSLADPIRLNRDVINIAGATISASAMTRGVRKVLTTLDELYLQRLGPAFSANLKAQGKRMGPPTPRARKPVEARRLVMGSLLRVVTLDGPGDPLALVHRALDEADRIDAILSNYRADSELSGLNLRGATSPVPLSDTLWRFLEHSQRLHDLTGGAYDPTLGRIHSAWGFSDPERNSRPDLDWLQAQLASTGMKGVQLNTGARTAFFRRSGVRLDPGAMGKGIAVDAVIAGLRASRIQNALVDFGSSQRGMGPGPEGRGWPVTLRDPRDPDRALQTVWLVDQALSCSGGREKFVTIDGEILPHILDPRTGHPAEASLGTAVIDDLAQNADALSTALFVLGPTGLEQVAASGRTMGLVVDAAGDLHKSVTWPDPAGE